jgi:hypothetical protein
MVSRIERKFNKPIGRIRGFPIFWLTELSKSEWHCQWCREKQGQGSVALELTVRRKQFILAGLPGLKLHLYEAVQQQGFDPAVAAALKQWLESEGVRDSAKYASEIDQAAKLFICMQCSKRLFGDVLERVDAIAKLGVAGYRFMDEV